MNYYELLEVSENASPEVIEMAYKALMRKYHPDVYRDDPEFAHTMAQKINEAHQVLSDPQSRAQYDSSRKDEEDESAPGPKAPSVWNQIPKSSMILALFCLLLALASGLLFVQNSSLTEEKNRTEEDLRSAQQSLSDSQKALETAEQDAAVLSDYNDLLYTDLNYYYENACVITNYSKRYHHFGCDYLDMDRAYILDVDNADRLGYSPCGRCWDEDFDSFYEKGR